MVLPRFCLESYLVSPSELWAAFPPKQQAKVEGGEAAFRNDLLAFQAEWIRHAAVWHAVRPLWQKLQKAGFADVASKKPPNIPNDEELLETFRGWSALLGNADKLLENVQGLESKMKNLDADELCRNWLHAKHFYAEAIHPLLDKMLGQKPAKERRLSIFRSRQVPPDLDVVWQRMGLNT